MMSKKNKWKRKFKKLQHNFEKVERPVKCFGPLFMPYPIPIQLEFISSEPVPADHVDENGVYATVRVRVR